MKKIQISKNSSLEDIKKIGINCDVCGNCCRFGSGFILESEIQPIAKHLSIKKGLLEEKYLNETEIFNTKIFKFKCKKKKGAPYGPCMFLKENKCEIHDVKPLHCQIGNCKEHGDDLHTWYIINYCLNPFDPESIRQYDSYIKTGGRLIPGASLKEIFPDKKMLKKILSYERLK